MIRASTTLREFVDKEVLPGTGVEPRTFWSGLAEIAADLGPRNAALLAKRDDLQAAIDEWHKRDNSAGAIANHGDYLSFLHQSGYLLPIEPAAQVESANVDPEIASIAGPQLVCPADNARFLLNAANARWGSLLDAIYGTNALLPPPPKGPYCAERGEAVWAQVHGLLDELFPLANGQWANVNLIKITDGELRATLGNVNLGLRDPSQLAGHTASGDRIEPGEVMSGSCWSVLLKNNGLHVELVLDRTKTHARRTEAGLIDVRLESALSTICDFEDSASCVDADDKVNAYRNWLGLMTRSLNADVPKGGSTIKRTLHAPRTWRSPKGDGSITLPGQSVLLARNVGMHMMTDMITTAEGEPLPEHFVDAMVTAAVRAGVFPSCAYTSQKLRPFLPNVALPFSLSFPST